jgi:precorrin-6B methylase 2
VPTRHDTVRDLLWLADVSTNDVVYDLGSGDGRVVIAAVRDFHARRAVGIELDAKLVDASRSNAVAAGVADRVKFIHGDLFTNDFSAASMLVLYLGQGANLDLRAKVIRTLKTGARVASHQYGMGEWMKDKTLIVRTYMLGMYGTV